MNARQARHYDVVTGLISAAAMTMLLGAIALVTAEAAVYAHILGELIAPIAGALR